MPEPKKSNNSLLLIPSWVRSEVNNMLNELNGAHSDVMVAAVALMGENGFCCKSREQTTSFVASEYGPAMLEGYSIIAGEVMAKVLGTVVAATMNPNHFTHDIADETERFQQLRNLYEQAIREFLFSALNYAGANFQRDNPSSPTVAAGSQMLALWKKVAHSTITFKTPNDTPKEPPTDGERPE